jgi:hypothetical protein
VSDTKHNPTPWRVVEKAGETYRHVNVVDADGVPVAWVYRTDGEAFSGGEDARMRANAERVVAAVNAADRKSERWTLPHTCVVVLLLLGLVVAGLVKMLFFGETGP